MRRKVFVAIMGAIAVLGVFAEACMVGRDLTYVDPSARAIDEGQVTPGGEAGASGDPNGQGSSGGQGVSPGPQGDGTSDGGTTKTEDAGHDGGTTKPPPGCPAGATAEIEPNDQSTQATKMSQNENCGSLVVGSDEDFWMFVTGKGGFIDITFNADTDAILGIVDLDDPTDDGTTLTSGREITIGGAIPGDRYYLKVFSPGLKTQGYRIKLDNE
jgi:hypothetical protein